MGEGGEPMGADAGAGASDWLRTKSISESVRRLSVPCCGALPVPVRGVCSRIRSRFGLRGGVCVGGSRSVLRLRGFDGMVVLSLDLRNRQQGQQFGIERRKLVGQYIAQGGVGDLPCARNDRHFFQCAAVSVANDRRAKRIVALVAGKAEQLSNARFDVGQLFAELFFQFVGLGRSRKPVFKIEFIDQGQAAIRWCHGWPGSVPGGPASVHPESAAQSGFGRWLRAC